MLQHCGLAENFWEEATLYAVDIYNRVTAAKPIKVGPRQRPFEKLYGEIPSLDELRPFGCMGFAFIPIRGKTHKKRSVQIMYMRKEFGKIGRARFYHPPSNAFGTSGHVKWHPESLYDPNMSKYVVTARIQGEGRLGDYQFLVSTKHFDDEDGCYT